MVCIHFIRRRWSRQDIIRDMGRPHGSTLCFEIPRNSIHSPGRLYHTQIRQHDSIRSRNTCSDEPRPSAISALLGLKVRCRRNADGSGPSNCGYKMIGSSGARCWQ